MSFSIFLSVLIALTRAFTAGTHRSVYVFGYMALDFTLPRESVGMRYERIDGFGVTREFRYADRAFYASLSDSDKLQGAGLPDAVTGCGG